MDVAGAVELVARQQSNALSRPGRTSSDSFGSSSAIKQGSSSSISVESGFFPSTHENASAATFFSPGL